MDWYPGLLRNVIFQVKKSTSLSTPHIRGREKKVVSEEKIIRLTSVFLRRALELRYLNSFGQISRTISTYSILPCGAPVFDMCIKGDLKGLQAVLDSGNISPLVVDEHGWTLFHVSWPKQKCYIHSAHSILARGKALEYKNLRFSISDRRRIEP